MSKRSRGSQSYIIKLPNSYEVRVSGALYHDWRGRGFLIETGFKRARVAMGYSAWVDPGGQPQIERNEPLISTRIPITNYDRLALYAIWTPHLTAFERQWEIQAQYGGTVGRKSELRVGMDLGRFVFRRAHPRLSHKTSSIQAARAGVDEPRLQNLQLEQEN